MICVICGRDINAIGQDNVSCISGYPMCEDCVDDWDLQELDWPDPGAQSGSDNYKKTTAARAARPGFAENVIQ